MKVKWKNIMKKNESENKANRAFLESFLKNKMKKTKSPPKTPRSPVQKIPNSPHITPYTPKIRKPGIFPPIDEKNRNRSKKVTQSMNVTESGKTK